MKRLSGLGSILLICMLFIAVTGCNNDSSETPVDGDTDIADGDTDGDIDGDTVTEEETEQEASYPDPESIWELRTREGRPPTADSLYKAEESTHFRTLEQLPDVDIRCMRKIGDTLYAGTATGLVRFDSDAQTFVPVVLDGIVEPIIDIAANMLGEGTLVLARSNAVVTLTSEGLATAYPIADHTVTAVAVLNEGIQVGTTTGVGSLDDSHVFQPITLPNGITWEVTDLAVSNDILYVATANTGLLFVQNGNPEAAVIDPDSSFRALDVCADGKVLAGSAANLVLLSNMQKERSIDPGPGSLPTNNVTSVACGSDWWVIGHEIGGTAIKPDLSHVDHYVSYRWVTNNAIRAVVVDDAGSRWFATENGVSRIDLVDRTAYEKAMEFEQILDDHFWRLEGFVASDARLDDPWSFENVSLYDKDNDGLWTQMMIGGWAFAAAATGEQQYCEKARKAINNMIMQIDLPCISFTEAGKTCGFITRSFVRDDEGSVFDDKATQDNWHLVTYEGHDYYWKDDTSADEYAGHFFGYPLYYDLCATDDEKLVLEEKISLVTQYLIDNGYTLPDLDGETTTHGNWDPAHISICIDENDEVDFGYCLSTAEDTDPCEEACYGGGWLNSMEIMGTMLSAYHITGNTDFYDAYRYLVDEHKYDIVAMFTENVFTATRRYIQNHSDHELAMLAYHTLIRYEPDEELRNLYIQSLVDFLVTEKPERHPLWNAFEAGLAGRDYEQDDAVRTIREYPRDLREWYIDHSHRLDYQQDPADDRHGDEQITEVPPYDEIRSMWWNGNPYILTSGGDGRSLNGPMAYLLAYWSMRYYGLLDAPATQ